MRDERHTDARADKFELHCEIHGFCDDRWPKARETARSVNHLEAGQVSIWRDPPVIGQVGQIDVVTRERIVGPDCQPDGLDSNRFGRNPVGQTTRDVRVAMHNGQVGISRDKECQRLLRLGRCKDKLEAGLLGPQDLPGVADEGAGGRWNAATRYLPTRPPRIASTSISASASRSSIS